MSDNPATPNNVNSPIEIKKRTAAMLVRRVQEIAPYFDNIRLIVQEVNDVVEMYGTVTDADLADLGVTAATITNLHAFATKLNEFMDAGTASRKSYRTSVNSVKRVAAQI